MTDGLPLERNDERAARGMGLVDRDRDDEWRAHVTVRGAAMQWRCDACRRSLELALVEALDLLLDWPRTGGKQAKQDDGRPERAQQF
jgi:hypothetical protein